MKILIVEDDRPLSDSLRALLEDRGYQVEAVYDGEAGVEYAMLGVYDLIILDVMLPDIDGFALCKKIREKHTWPIIMLTAKDAETDKITGLTLGADDYVTKPFRPLELAARVKSQLRRYKKYNPARAGGAEPVPPADTLLYGDLVMNTKAHACSLDGEPLELTPTEFSILRILLENRGSAVSAEELFHQIWKDEYYSKSNNTITVHIRHLREKLGDRTDKPKYIKTVWGVGYKIEANG